MPSKKPTSPPRTDQLAGAPFRVDYDPPGHPGPGLSVPARLRSALLDPEMHHGDAVYLSLPWPRASDAEMPPDSGLHPYVKESLAAYLASQAAVRRALQKALDTHLAEWDKRRRLGRGAEIWRHVRVSEVVVSLPPRPWTPERMEQHVADLRGKLAPRLLKQMISGITKMTTPSRTNFGLVLDADWGDQHTRLAMFKDGRLDEFRVDG